MIKKLFLIAFLITYTLASVSAPTDATYLSTLTAKEKSLLGIGVHPGFQDFFNTVANDADPSTTYWSVVENGAGTVKVENDTGNIGYINGGLVCFSGGTTGDDGIAYTQDKWNIALKNGVTTVHFKARATFTWSAHNGDNCGIGLMENDAAPSDISALTSTGGDALEIASIAVLDQKPYAFSSDGTTTESTDLSSYISVNTAFTMEIRITSSDVKFYVDGTLRATHNTNVPSSVWQMVVGATCEGNNNQYIYADYAQCWGE